MLDKDTFHASVFHLHESKNQSYLHEVSLILNFNWQKLWNENNNYIGVDWLAQPQNEQSMLRTSVDLVLLFLPISHLEITHICTRYHFFP